MINIEIDNGSGFCFGVTTAIKKAEEELAKGNTLYCLGDIVHNGRECDRLKQLGLITINHEEFKNLKNAKVLLRAHGEPPSTYEIAKQNNIEIIDATFEFLDGSYIAEPVDVTEYLGTDEMINFQNQYVLFKGMTVAASKDADGNDAAFLYKWNGSGQEGDDLYFNVEYNGQIYTFTVESYLRDKDSDVYQAVKNLNIGDKIDLAGYAYWYDTLNPHIITVVAAEE